MNFIVFANLFGISSSPSLWPLTQSIAFFISRGFLSTTEALTSPWGWLKESYRLNSLSYFPYVFSSLMTASHKRVLHFPPFYTSGNSSVQEGHILHRSRNSTLAPGTLQGTAPALLAGAELTRNSCYPTQIGLESVLLRKLGK